MKCQEIVSHSMTTLHTEATSNHDVDSESGTRMIRTVFTFNYIGEQCKYQAVSANFITNITINDHVMLSKQFIAETNKHFL